VANKRMTGEQLKAFFRLDKATEQRLASINKA
jgi:hypothetical protein